MKTTITKNATYDITINGIEHKDFKKDGVEWNGLCAYKNKEGTIISTGESFADGLFSFLRADNDITEDLNIVMLSPCFMPVKKEGES